MSLPVVRWPAPGPYEVAFSTRLGGVSEPPFDSLNLGRLTADEAPRVEENRRRLCAEVGADPARLSFNRQVHGARLHKADPRARGRPGDGLWSDEPGVAMMAFTADCLPIVLTRADGAVPALGVLHVGWRGLLDGIVAAGASALGGGALRAVIGPGIGPCCYEVGDEVAAPFTEAFGAGVVTGGFLDLWTAAERALRAAGVARVDRLDRCTACSPQVFFSHRRDGGQTGRQGVIAYVS